MTARVVLRLARSAGVSIGVEGDDLILEAAATPATAVIETIMGHKAELLALLRTGRDGWSPDDWQTLYEERLAILQEGGADAARAAAEAIKHCVSEWQSRNFEASQPDRCAHCGKAATASDALLALEADNAGHVWVHQRCLEMCRLGRKMQAEDLVTNMLALGSTSAKLPRDFDTHQEISMFRGEG